MSTELEHITVLHILDHSLPLHSGYSFRSRGILLSQKERGWNPVAVTSPKHEASWKNGTAPIESIDGIRVYRSGSAAEGWPVVSEIRLMRALYRRLIEIIRAERPAVLHAHSPVLNAFPALWAGRRFGVPVVYELRAYWEDAAVDHGTYGLSSARYKLVAALETQVCRWGTEVAVLCEGIRRDLIARGIDPRKITPVPNAVDPAVFGECAPALDLAEKWGVTGKQVVGFIGSFYRYEGLDLLIDAAAKLASKHPRMVLLLVGGGMMEASLREQVERLGLHDRVVFTGRVPHHRIAGIYALTSLLVYPRYSIRLTDLVTPLKPLEAMAMRKPCVASDVGGHRELIEHGRTGLLFPAGDSEALATAISDLLEDEARIKAIGEQGRDWVLKERTWSKTTANYVEIYRRALRNHGTQFSPAV